MSNLLNGVTYRDMWELQYGGFAKGYLIHGYANYNVTWDYQERVGTRAYLQ